MYKEDRIRRIEALVKKSGFVTVKFLTEELHYSTATINRDLNLMEKRGIIKRSYGGAELLKTVSVPLRLRYHKMRPSKNKIARKAAEYVCDGDTVFLDGSTTVECMGKYLTDKKNLTVITNNLSLASYLSEHKITVFCLGGQIIEPPSMAYSVETVENIGKFGANKSFFSTTGITRDGMIWSQYDIYTMVIKAMIENSERSFLLIDNEKVVPGAQRYLGSLDAVSDIITDFEFSDEIKQEYAATMFTEV